MTNLAIIGSTGYIGSNLYQYLLSLKYNIVKIDRSSDDYKLRLDLNSPENFNYDIFKDIDVVIFAAAISSPDLCTKEFTKSYRINVINTKSVIRKILKYNTKIIFLSSDSVFSGIKRACLYENSKVIPNTEYGMMKAEIENTFKTNKQFKIARLSYVLSKNDKFLKYIMNCQKEGTVAEIYHPFYRNIVFLEEVMETIRWIICNLDNDINIINVTGNELISRLEIVDALNIMLNMKIKYSLSTPSKDFFNARPSITEMRSIWMNSIIQDYQISFFEKAKKYLK